MTNFLRTVALGRRQSILGAGLLVVGALALTGPSGVGSVPQEPDLEGTRDAYSAWLKTETLISEEQRDWRLRLDEQDESIRLLERQIARLAEDTEEARAEIRDAEERTAKLESEEAATREGLAVLEGRIVGLEGRLRELLPRLPASLRELEAFTLLEGRLPAEDADSSLPLSQRYLTVIGLLNEVDKFQRDLHVVSQRHTLADGRQVSAETLYLGLSLAFYVTADGKHAGRGIPGPEGWAWLAADESAESIASALEILRGDSPAAFVSLPVDIR